jgi:Nitrate and nitrite sensing/Histidine kinase-, DNA gyrase B-, and HSP90-like ATPase
MRTGHEMGQQPTQTTARRSARVVVLAIALLAVLVLAGLGMAGGLRAGARAERVRGLVPFSGALATLVHELQGERRLSAAQPAAGPALDAARVAVDRAAAAYRDAAVRVEISDRDRQLHQRLDAGLAQLADLAALRASVDAAVVGDPDAPISLFRRYTAVVGGLLGVGGEIGQQEAGQDAGLLRAVSAAALFSRAKELADRERSAAAQASAGRVAIDQAERIRLAAIGGRQDALLDQFAALATSQQRAWYSRAFPAADVERSVDLRRAALEGRTGPGPGPDLAGWAGSTTDRFERMREVELGLNAEVARQAALAERAADRRMLAYAVAFLLAASALVVLLVLAPGRSGRTRQSGATQPDPPAPSPQPPLPSLLGLPDPASPGPQPLPPGFAGLPDPSVPHPPGSVPHPPGPVPHPPGPTAGSPGSRVAANPPGPVPGPPVGERNPTGEGGPAVVHIPPTGKGGAPVGHPVPTVGGTGLPSGMGGAPVEHADPTDPRPGGPGVADLARRSQELVDQQLELLDRVGRDQADPRLPGRLLQLDRLAVRARRNAHNLIVLAGGEPSRRWDGLAPLAEMAAVAVQDNPDATRVDLEVADSLLVPGVAADDLANLLAELVDNATAFSTPETRVRVGGQKVGSGYVLEVEDQGLGMTDGELDAVNRRLAGGPAAGDGLEQGLGTWVAGRLAERHGVRVQLRHSPYGGVTALVFLPERLVVAAGEPGPAVPAPPVPPPAVPSPAGDQAGDTAMARMPTRRYVPQVPGVDQPLPKRAPHASLAPDLAAGQPGDPASRPAARSPEQVRSMLTRYRSGLERGRAAAARDLPDDPDDDPLP